MRVQEPRRCDVCHVLGRPLPHGCILAFLVCRMHASEQDKSRKRHVPPDEMVRSACHRVSTGLVSVLVLRHSGCEWVASGAVQAFQHTTFICSSPEEAPFWMRLVCCCAGLPILECFSYNLTVLNLCAAAAGRARSAVIVIVASAVIQICRGADRAIVQRDLEAWPVSCGALRCTTRARLKDAT